MNMDNVIMIFILNVQEGFGTLISYNEAKSLMLGTCNN